jgi:predicted DNA-binding WGR domain protein
MSISVEIPDLERFRAQLRGMPPELRLEQRKAVSAAATIVRDEVQRRIHSPGGHAAKGIKIKVSGTGVDMQARITSGNRQAVFAQRSRGAGTMPPPMKAARAMARRYGIPMEKARALAVMIGRRGTRGHPVMRDAFNATRREVEHAFTAALAAIARKAARG